MVLSEAEGLLKIATADLETAEASSDPAVFREGAWGFWLQQAVEKALKAWLLHLDVGAPLTHDLRRLLLLLAVFAVQFRYDADPTPLGLDRAHYNRQVKALLARVNALILPGSDIDP
jgi:HEPN domain-containing protein